MIKLAKTTTCIFFVWSIIASVYCYNNKIWQSSTDWFAHFFINSPFDRIIKNIYSANQKQNKPIAAMNVIHSNLIPYSFVLYIIL